MIHNDIQNQLAFLIKTSAPPLIDIAESSTELPQLVPGQQVPAHVIASLPNGRFQVMVQDSVLDMNLPRNTQPGDTLQLVFVSNTPRPTFTLLADIVKASPQNASNAVNLSQVGKFIGELSQRPVMIGDRTDGASALNSAGPVIPRVPSSTQELAIALKNTLSQSGLFYESHQAQWISGKRSLETLLLEPQAKLLNLPNAGSPINTEAKSSNQLLSQSVATSSSNLNSQQLLNKGSSFNMDTQPAVQNLTSAVTEPVHPSATALVQQQLDMLDTRQILWQGQVWPGQVMEWEINEDGNRQNSNEDAPEMWRTRLHLNFPVLGGVTAHLALGTNGLKVDFSVDQEQSASLMRGEVPILASAMEASGLTVARIAVGISSESQDGHAG